jgi:DNA replication protein DnaC
MDEDLLRKLKYLKLKWLIEHWSQTMKTAQSKKPSFIRFLTQIIDNEFSFKKENARNSRIRRADIPEVLVFETYPFNKQPKLNKRRLSQIFDSMDYIKEKKNVIFVGPTGVGKSGLATALLVQAINQGASGRFILFHDLVEKLFKSVGDHTQEAIVRKFSSYDCLLVDEMGYVEMEPSQVGLFFTLMSKRHKKKTTLITSNLGFNQWDSFLKNKPLTAALIDRLTANSHVINMKDCRSLRNLGKS